MDPSFVQGHINCFNCNVNRTVSNERVDNSATCKTQDMNWEDEFLASMVIYQSIYYLLLSLTTGHSDLTKIPNKPIIFLHNGIHIFFKLKSRLATDNPPKFIPCLSPFLCIRTYQINCKILKFLSLFILL